MPTSEKNDYIQNTYLGKKNKKMFLRHSFSENDAGGQLYIF